MKPVPTLHPDITVADVPEHTYFSPCPTIFGRRLISDEASAVMRPVWEVEKRYLYEVENELNTLLFNHPEPVDVTYADGKRLKVNYLNRYLYEVLAVKSVPTQKYFGKPKEDYREIRLGLAPWSRDGKSAQTPIGWYPAWGTCDPHTLTQILEIVARKLYPHYM